MCSGRARQAAGARASRHPRRDRRNRPRSLVAAPSADGTANENDFARIDTGPTLATWCSLLSVTGFTGQLVLAEARARVSAELVRRPEALRSSPRPARRCASPMPRRGAARRVPGRRCRRVLRRAVPRAHSRRSRPPWASVRTTRHGRRQAWITSSRMGSIPETLSCPLASITSQATWPRGSQPSRSTARWTDRRRVLRQGSARAAARSTIGMVMGQRSGRLGGGHFVPSRFGAATRTVLPFGDAPSSVGKDRAAPFRGTPTFACARTSARRRSRRGPGLGRLAGPFVSVAHASVPRPVGGFRSKSRFTVVASAGARRRAAPSDRSDVTA